MGGLVVITRPIEDAKDYAAEVSAEGFKALVEPMLRIDQADFDVPDLARYDGIVVTSANAVECFVKGGGIRADVPVYCVGKHTADAALKAGFFDVVSVDGIGADLLAHVLTVPDVQSKTFLHLCGRHLAFPLVERLRENGVVADSLVVYDSVQVDDFSNEFIECLKHGEIGAVTFFSKRTADAFVFLVNQSGSEAYFKGIKALLISEAVVECVRVLPWQNILVSDTPDRVGMMQILRAYV